MNLRTFGDELRQAREERAVSLENISDRTRIPVGTLVRLEDGRFDELPADVFVRGFLRQYARCVGLEPEETVRRYRRSRAITTTGRHEIDTEDAYAEAIVVVDPHEASGVIRSPTLPTVEMDTPAAASLSARVGSGTGRVTITLTVIILVIVATLTLSYLLRDPGRPGDGITARPAVADRVV